MLERNTASHPRQRSNTLVASGDSDPSHVKVNQYCEVSAISRDVTYPQVVTNKASHLL